MTQRQASQSRLSTGMADRKSQKLIEPPMNI